ncbi:MAG TPA: hypothetical protein PK181_04415 [Methanothrix soehngenii]|nr:hypothetical protein [Methanothrix soehngenii]
MGSRHLPSPLKCLNLVTHFNIFNGTPRPVRHEDRGRLLDAILNLHALVPEVVIRAIQISERERGSRREHSGIRLLQPANFWVLGKPLPGPIHDGSGEGQVSEGVTEDDGSVTWNVAIVRRNHILSNKEEVVF